MSEKKCVLRAKQLHKSFHSPKKVEIIKELDFALFEGETVAITGRSGEGKSTLLHLLGTLEQPTRGQLEIAGITVSGWNTAKIRNKHIAFIFQSFHLLDDLSAIDNVLMPAKISRQETTKGSPAFSRALALLDKMGLKERAQFSTKLLSGGEKQRVAIARALCNNPDIILADEPSGNLDKQTAAQIHSLLISFAKNEGKSIVFVTHDPDLVKMCDTQYLLHKGRLNAL